MTDYQAEAVSKKRVPRDNFEAELFRRHIQEETSRWYDNERIHVSVSDGHGDGAYGLYVWEPNEDLLKMMEPKRELRGKVWLQESPYPVSEFYRVQVWHEVEGRRANYGHPPLLRSKA